MVTQSPWPLAMSMAALLLTLGLTMYMHAYKYGLFILCCGVFYVIGVFCFWWRDVIREATFEGSHTRKVQESTRLAFILFIVSEVMFFFGFFWAYFYNQLSPSIHIGGRWPPEGIAIFDPMGTPLVNTIILLLSGVSITYTHASLYEGNVGRTFFGFIETLKYALVFTLLQCGEYITAAFSIADGIYGSVFYMITGLHGAHVIIGTLFIAVCFFRFLKGHFTKQHHVGFELSVWYWHFVDIVWLFVFCFIYCLAYTVELPPFDAPQCFKPESI